MSQLVADHGAGGDERVAKDDCQVQVRARYVQAQGKSSPLIACLRGGLAEVLLI
jgi:hypothetical protein